MGKLQNKTTAVILALAIASASGSAGGMTHSPSRPAHCRVFGGEKLPAEIGGPQALCATIEAAVRQRLPSTSFAVEVRVLSDSSLAATVKLRNGRTLPEQRMAVSDRKLNRGSVLRFASAIASQIAEAGGQ